MLSPGKSAFITGGPDDVVASQFGHQNMPFFLIERIEYPESGGIMVYKKGLKHPTKGFVFPEALSAINQAKRAMMTFIDLLQIKPIAFGMCTLLIMPWSVKRRALDHIGRILNRSMLWPVRPFLLKDQYLTPVATEVLKFCGSFFKRLGIRKWGGLARSLSAIIEYDFAYRYRLEDIMSEASKEKMLDEPEDEMKRLAEIYLEREQAPGQKKKMFYALWLIRIALWFKPVRTAFIESIKEMDFEKMSLDVADRYHVLHRAGYNFLGLTDDVRHEIWIKEHDGNPPQQYVLVKEGVEEPPAQPAA